MKEEKLTESLLGNSRGVIEQGDEAQMIAVLNLPALLADERLIIQEEVREDIQQKASL